MKDGIEVKIESLEEEIQIPVHVSDCACGSEYQCPVCEENGGCSRPVNGENRTGENGIKPDENVKYKTGDCKK